MSKFYTKYLFGCYLLQPRPLPYQLVTDIWSKPLLKGTIQWPYPYLIQVYQVIFFLAFPTKNFDGSKKATTSERKSKLQIPRYAVYNDLVEFSFSTERVPVPRLVLCIPELVPYGEMG